MNFKFSLFAYEITRTYENGRVRTYFQWLNNDDAAEIGQRPGYSVRKL